MAAGSSSNQLTGGLDMVYIIDIYHETRLLHVIHRQTLHAWPQPSGAPA
jgi:hypothetical protein